LPHWFSIVGEKASGARALLMEFFQPLPIPCGSWLACDSGGSASIYTDRDTAFASKPAPTLVLYCW
ncbi:hypothetical protein ACW9IN_30115, partial [Pseudomonas sp. SDO5271_S396]